MSPVHQIFIIPRPDERDRIAKAQAGFGRSCCTIVAPACSKSALLFDLPSFLVMMVDESCMGRSQSTGAEYFSLFSYIT